MDEAPESDSLLSILFEFFSPLGQFWTILNDDIELNSGQEFWYYCILIVLPLNVKRPIQNIRLSFRSNMPYANTYTSTRFTVVCISSQFNIRPCPNESRIAYESWELICRKSIGRFNMRILVPRYYYYHYYYYGIHLSSSSSSPFFVVLLLLRNWELHVQCPCRPLCLCRIMQWSTASIVCICWVCLRLHCEHNLYHLIGTEKRFPFLDYDLWFMKWKLVDLFFILSWLWLWPDIFIYLFFLVSTNAKFPWYSQRHSPFMMYEQFFWEWPTTDTERCRSPEARADKNRKEKKI